MRYSYPSYEQVDNESVGKERYDSDGKSGKEKYAQRCAVSLGEGKCRDTLRRYCHRYSENEYDPQI